jgi:hypothetical protein
METQMFTMTFLVMSCCGTIAHSDFAEI